MRRSQSTFSDQVREQLQQCFQKDPYPTRSQREDLAKKLGLSGKAVLNWFSYNRILIRKKEGQIRTDDYNYC